MLWVGMGESKVVHLGNVSAEQDVARKWLCGIEVEEGRQLSWVVEYCISLHLDNHVFRVNVKNVEFLQLSQAEISLGCTRGRCGAPSVHE